MTVFNVPNSAPSFLKEFIEYLKTTHEFKNTDAVNFMLRPQTYFWDSKEFRMYGGICSKNEYEGKVYSNIKIASGTKESALKKEELVMVTAHEFRHAIQNDLDDPTIADRELDADLFALKVTKEYLGRDITNEVNLYPQTKAYLLNTPEADWFTKLPQF